MNNMFNIGKKNVRLNNKISSYVVDNDKNIPKIVHFVFGLKQQDEEFNLIYALSIVSAKIVIEPEKIYFWYHYEPKGYWWEQVKVYLDLKQIDIPNKIGIKDIKKIAHKADIVRMKILKEYGGIYLDMDTISINPINHLLDNSFVMGKEENDSLCNAIMMGNKNSKFLKEWIRLYYNHFNPNGWGEASLNLPKKISKYIKDIKILEEDVFFKPGWKEVEKIFVNKVDKIPDNLLILHLWESFSMKYYTFNSIKELITDNETLYGKIVKYLIKNKNLLNYIKDK